VNYVLHGYRGESAVYYLALDTRVHAAVNHDYPQ